jgi:hypothetical protein
MAPSPTPFYTRPPVLFDPRERNRVNTGILNLIRAGQKPDPARVFTGYTGRGGLHQLDYRDFTNRHAFTTAKQGIENGQFFSPDNVVHLASQILKPAPGATVCDPTCGHGAFFNWFQDCLLLGNDVDPEAALVGQYVFPKATIQNTDLRLYNPGSPCDFVVGNPPFGLRWATEGNWQRETIVSKRSEDIFLEFIARHLCRGGSAIFVVPEAWPRDEMVYAETNKLLTSHFIVEGEFLLNPALFKAYGCDHISTKLFLIRTRLSPEETQGPVPIVDTDDRPLQDILEEWQIVGRRYAEFRALASTIRARLTLEQTRDVAESQDKLLAYTFHKYAYHLSRVDKIAAARAWQRWADSHKPMPKEMKFEEWDRTRLRPQTVIRETRTAVCHQSRKPLPLIRLSQTKNGLVLKSYGPAAAAALTHQARMWSWLDLEEADPDFSAFNENLARLNQRPDKEKLQFTALNWQKVVRRNKRRLAAWRQSVHQPPNAANLLEVARGYEILATEYGLPVHREPLQEERLAQIIDKPGALLAWQQGVGKTYAALVYALLKANRDRTAKRRVGANLLVTSSLSVNMNWLPELRKAGRHILTRKEDFHLARPESWVVLTHAQAYQLRRTIRRLSKQRIITCLLLDEADEYSNHSSRRYKAVRAFANHIRYRLLTTGTPARNTAAELFTQLEIIFGGSPAFQCVAPHLIGEDKDGRLVYELNAAHLEPYAPFRGYGLFRRCHAPTKTTVLGQRRDIPEITNREQLQAFLSTIRSRLTLEDVLGYDPVLPRVVNITAMPAETALYHNILKNTCTFIRRELSPLGQNSRKFNQLAIAHAIRLLQQSCSTPRKFPEFTGQTQSKLEYILSQCEERSHSHIAVGTIWRVAALEIAEVIQQRSQTPVFLYTGDESMAQRQRVLTAFENTPRAVLVTTQQALRSSVNIRSVSKVIAESLPWNFSSLGQYARRFARYDSQHKTVELDLLVTENTIEERILGLNIRKEIVALVAAGDSLDDDQDPILDKYGVHTSTLILLVEYLQGEKDTSLDISHLKKDLRQPQVV